MRYHRMRFDIWLTMLIVFGISVGTVRMAELILAETYKSYVEKHTVADGDIGGRAGKDVFRAQSVDDLLSHDTFTIVSPGIEYRNRGAGYYGNYCMYAVTLPSGERVAVAINMEGVQYAGEYYSSEHTLPVGRVVYEDLTFNENFIHQIEYSEPLSRTDFYVDMLGVGGKASQEVYTSSYTSVVQVVTILVCFPLIHALGARIGLFPYFFAPRRKQEEQKGEWE
ncbi:MAG: hypothetical protein K2M15_06400 [Oscillospiraceae bacterium]|nr:hypothetical protein [Oscillospiraceae bacterium]MDE7170765.1 hypothetical protein [Oscillospiraceae bacterium]